MRFMKTSLVFNTNTIQIPKIDNKRHFRTKINSNSKEPIVYLLIIIHFFM